MAYLELG